MALTGRICLVTGASKGVGRGIAVQLGEAGATVYITGRSVDKLKECAAEIQKRGGKVCTISIFFIRNFVRDSDGSGILQEFKWPGIPITKAVSFTLYFFRLYNLGYISNTIKL